MIGLEAGISFVIGFCNGLGSLSWIECFWLSLEGICDFAAFWFLIVWYSLSFLKIHSLVSGTATSIGVSFLLNNRQRLHD